MASKNTPLLLLLSISCLFLSFPHSTLSQSLFFSTSTESEESSILVSYISASPGAAPAAAPGTAPAPDASSFSVSEAQEAVDDALSGMSEEKKEQVFNFVEKNVQAVKAKAEQLAEQVLSKGMSNPFAIAGSLGCLRKCQEDFGGANDESAGLVLQAVSTKDLQQVEAALDSFSSDVGACSQCLNEAAGDDFPEIKEFEEYVNGVTADCKKELATLKD